MPKTEEKMHHQKSMSAKEYRELILASSPSKSTEKKNFAFTVSVKKEAEHTYCISLSGRHYSTNAINSFHFREKLRYKTAIKNAFAVFMMRGKNRFILKPKKPLEKANLKPYSYCKKSRDDDGNFTTIKVLRDCLTEHGFIADDARKNLTMERDTEILGKEYKIELVLVAI